MLIKGNAINVQYMYSISHPDLQKRPQLLEERLFTLNKMQTDPTSGYQGLAMR